ncbi:MAG: glycosyltransferase family 1 protein, partial [Candidatus Phytoplasma sp.]|nr:glycosyltransferase family 1 protein [Phytoplasma sp.]
LVEAQASGLPCVISDTISNQTTITDLVNPISLNTPPKDWAKKVLEVSNLSTRENTSDAVVKSGFDIKNTAKELEEFYLKIRK